MVNPLFGFLLSIAVFFDNSRTEAITMLIFESGAVCFEYLVYRMKRQLRLEKKIRLDDINQQLEPFFISNRKAVASKAVGMDVTFHDEDFLAMEDETVADHKEIRLLRSRRYLRQELIEDQKKLNYYLAGVTVNSILIVVSVTFLITISTTGGMCVFENQLPSPFARNPLESCSACQGTTGVCEICTLETPQCYYPY